MATLIRLTPRKNPATKRTFNLDFVHEIEPHAEGGSILHFLSGNVGWECAVLETCDQIQALARPG